MSGLQTFCRNLVIVRPCRSIKLFLKPIEDEIMRTNGICHKLCIAASLGLAMLMTGCVAYPAPYYPGPAYAVAAPPIYLGGGYRGYGGGYGGGWGGGHHWR